MPKHIFEPAMEAVKRDIRNDFSPNDRYRSLRNISEFFQVSIQTAQKIVKHLENEGYVEVRNRSGVFVRNIPNVDPYAKVKNAAFLVVSNNGDPRFNQAFINGIKRVGDPYGVEVKLWVPRIQDHSTLVFGEAIVNECRSTGAIAAVSLAFQRTELAFYHILQSGILLVSDVDMPNLPILPSVQSDNHKHTKEAVRKFVEAGKKDVLVAGYWPEGNVRHHTFMEEFLRLVPTGKVRYVHLADEISPADLYIFFRHFTKENAVFSTDYAANHTVAPYFKTYEISPVGNFIVYDSEQENFEHPGLSPVPAAAPSLQALGRRIAEKIVDRIATDCWSEPLAELL